MRSFRIIIGVVDRELGNRGRSSPYQVYGAFYQISDRWLPVMYPDVTVTGRTRLAPAAIMPSIEAAVSLVLIGIAVLACYIPARRAARLEPTLALRNE